MIALKYQNSSDCSIIKDGNFCSTHGYQALMDWILPSPIKNRVGFGFKKKKKTRNGSKLGPGFYKNPTQPGYIYMYNYYNNLLYIYIVITLTKMPHLTHNLFKLQSRLSFLSSTHSPLPLSLTLLSCLSPSASLMLSCLTPSASLMLSASWSHSLCRRR